jgi:DNA-binding NarL/FixJ family response regulator
LTALRSPTADQQRIAAPDRAAIPLVGLRTTWHDAVRGDELKPVRVFVVDDHEAFRSAVAAMVEEMDGFDVVGSAASAEQSLELIRDTATDLVLMDVNLPGMTGIEAARLLSAGKDAPVVVLLSTYDEAELDFAGSGAVAYINKSLFSASQLSELWTAATS